ncbi:MAG: hypothetical protein IPM24_19170 [Bryobacterales bacterium]|nr:hypothetical protein [Bryobacterales bacterium]
MLKMPLKALAQGESLVFSVVYFVYAQAGTTLSAQPAVSTASREVSTQDNSVWVSCRVEAGDPQDVEGFVHRALLIVQEPFPEYRGNWFGDIVDNVFQRSSYQSIYLLALNSKTVAANLAATSREFLNDGDQENARKYAAQALLWHETAMKQFSLALDVYEGTILKVQEGLELPARTGCLALELLGHPVLAVLQCAAVDYAMKGAEEAAKNVVIKAAVSLLFKGIGVDTDKVLASTNQWLGNSGLFELIAARTRDPEIARQLMSVIAVSLNLAEQRAFDLADDVLRFLADSLHGVIIIEPSSNDSSSSQYQPTYRYLASLPFGEDLGFDGYRWPMVYETGIASAASYRGSGVSPGEVIVIFGVNVGPKDLISLRINEYGRIATSLGGVRILFDGVAAPLLYVSGGQVSAVVPFSVSRRESAQIQVEYRGVRSFPLLVPVVPANPGIFSLTMSGAGAGAIVNHDGIVNSSDAPAEAGSIVSLFVTGSGQTDPSGVDGEIIGGDLPRILLPTEVLIGGIAGEILYAGGAPGMLSGVSQINVRIPQMVRLGPDIPVVVRIGEWNSPEVITIAIR